MPNTPKLMREASITVRYERFYQRLSAAKANMDAYHLALFIHLLALILAAGATAVANFAAARRIRARTVGESLEWHRSLIAASRIFPICLVLFLATGAYMVSAAGANAWSSGFVVAGFVGVAFLLGSGTFLGIQARKLEGVLKQIATRGVDAPAPKLVPPPLITMLPAVNTGIALAVVFDMVIKPASISLALGALALGIVASAVVAWRGPRLSAKSDAVSARAA